MKEPKKNLLRWLTLVFAMFNVSVLSAQQMTKNVVSGNVLDSITNTPLSGINVYLKGKSQSSITDVAGKYILPNVTDSDTLVFSMVGYTSQIIPYDGVNTINVTLSPTKAMDEVVVTALGIQRKERSLGFATQKVSGTALQTVKGVDVGTSLTGQVAGLVVLNSTEFNATPTLQLRGETPLLVINGVPYGNLTLRDVPTDDIESIDVLKGPTASALYGSRGSAGAIMVTTKKGKGSRLSIDVNSNNMFTLGYIAIPKVQTSYAHGISGQISTDYVWGPKLDIGDSAMQWNPFTKQQEMMPLVSSGKNNLREFMQTGVISNNNITVMQSGENGFFRAGLNYIYNKGEWPNATLKIINYTMSGQLKIGKKFDAYASMGYTRQTTPQGWGSGYANQGYLYQILMWTGPDYNIKDYKDYWVVPNQKQNWMYTAWYDNPYLMAYEKLVSNQNNKLNASITANYYFNKDLKLMFRSGYDYYSNERTQRNPAGINSTTGGWSPAGYYGNLQYWGLSTNNDLILSYSKSVDKFSFDGLVGGSMYYYIDRTQGAGTVNGLAIPGWYSLANAVPSTVAGVNSISNTYTTSKRQINGAYAKLSTSYDEAVYLDLTGRNDWSSTQYSFQRSYFYPSAALSFILSKYLQLPSWVDLLKLRTSWTVSKYSLGVYSTNRAYTSGSAFGLRTNSYPTNLLGSDLPPSASRTWEYGLGAYLFKKRLHFDVAYFDKLFYDRQVSSSISNASGFSTSLVSTKERYANRGLEITVDGNIMQSRKFTWNSTINYSFVHSYWVELDPIYSTDDNWHKKGMRTDVYTQNEYARDPNGNYITVAGLPSKNPYASKIGYGDPDFSFGFINNFTVGNFLFGVNFDGRIGGLMYNYIWDKMFDTGANPETDNQNRYNQVVNKDNSFTSPGVKITSGTATYDKYGNLLSDTRQYATNDIAVGYQAYARSFRGGDYGIMSQSFVKLRQVSIGYNVPASTLKKYKGLKTASISLTGQNLFLWTKFKYSDPDVDTENLNAPSQRMVGVDIKLGF